jgi:hypothetical protein
MFACVGDYGTGPNAGRSRVEHRLRPGPHRPAARTGDSGAAIVSGPVQGHRFLYRPAIGTPAADTQEREAAQIPLMAPPSRGPQAAGFTPGDLPRMARIARIKPQALGNASKESRHPQKAEPAATRARIPEVAAAL